MIAMLNLQTKIRIYWFCRRYSRQIKLKTDGEIGSMTNVTVKYIYLPINTRQHPTMQNKRLYFICGQTTAKIIAFSSQ